MVLVIYIYNAVVNYYSVPKWGIFACDMEDVSLDIGQERYSILKTKQKLAERMEQTIIDMYDSNKRLEELLRERQ